jgi:hypothetical protein
MVENRINWLGDTFSSHLTLLLGGNLVLLKERFVYIV